MTEVIDRACVALTGEWVRKAFPVGISDAPLERCLRVVEETMELGQCHGMTKEHALALVEQVYSKPDGEILQEEGGVMICLLAYFAVTRRSPSQAWFTEFNRINNPETIEKIRAKHKLKVGTSLDGNGGMVRSK